MTRHQVDKDASEAGDHAEDDLDTHPHSLTNQVIQHFNSEFGFIKGIFTKIDLNVTFSFGYSWVTEGGINFQVNYVPGGTITVLYTKDAFVFQFGPIQT